MGAYYRHSGRISPSRLAIVLPLGFAAAVLLAFAYGYLFAYLPVVGYVSFILAAGFGLALGFGSGVLLRVAHVRSVPIAILATVLVTVVGYYASWIVWVHAIAGRSDVGIPLGELATSPQLLWAFISAINENGVMSISGWTPRGGVLWLFWFLEVVLIFGPAVLSALASMRGSAYCESCNAWCNELPPIDLCEHDLDEVGRRLDAGDVNALTSLESRPADAYVWTRVGVLRCGCHGTNALSVSKVWLKANDEGETSEETAVVIDRLLVEKSVVEQVEARRG
jgi:hypothetical protein